MSSSQAEEWVILKLSSISLCSPSRNQLKMAFLSFNILSRKVLSRCSCSMVCTRHHAQPFKDMTTLVILKAGKVIAGYGNPPWKYIIERLFILRFYLHSVLACNQLKYRAVLYLAARLVPYAYQSFPYNASSD